MVLVSVSNDIDETITIDCHYLDTLESCKNFFNAELYNFKILSFNIRSIQHNFDDFSVALKRLDSDIDIVILTECWLTEASVTDLLPGYNSYRSITQMNKNGGVVIFVKNSHSSTTTEPKLNDADCLLVTINDNITVLGIYRSPSTPSIDRFVDSLDTLLLSLNNSSFLVVAGDLNIDICSTSCNSDYLCLMASHHLLPAITKPTRGEACLDHIFTRSNCKSSGLVYDSSITDHYITLAGFSLSKHHIQCKPRWRLNTDVEAVAAELNQIDWFLVTLILIVPLCLFTHL